MKAYQSIPSFSKEFIGKECIGFFKYDGSNLRMKYSSKKGWHLFGTRYRLFDKSDPEYGPAIDIFLNKYASNMEKVIQNKFKNVQEIICFCEYFGPFSFAGKHDANDPILIQRGCKDNNPKDLMLFDVNIHKKGLLSPNEFLDLFGHLDVAKVVYQGILNEEFVNDIKNGKYPVKEGVICKGLIGKTPHGIWMTKIKTLAYLNELKKFFQNDWKIYE